MVEYSSELHKRCFPFLDKVDAEALLRAMDSSSILAGDVLYSINDAADCLYVLVAGRIAVQKFTGFGSRMQVVALLDPGAPIGEGGLLEAQTRGSMLSAVVDSHLLSLSRQSFAELTEIYPSLAVKILKWTLGRLSLRLKKSSERLAHVM